MGILASLVWVISQYYDIGGRLTASESDIHDLESTQFQEIQMRQELLEEVQSINVQVASIKKGNDVNLELLKQILGILKQ